MSNLVPERRLDKNGVWTTKHVRADSANGKTPHLPRVASPSKKKTKEDRALEKRVSAMSAKIPVSFNSSQYEIRANDLLKPVLRDSYSFSTSSDDFYGLLEKLTLADAIVLSDLSVKPETLGKFIKKNKYEPHLVDNSELVGELRARGIGFRTYIEVAASFDRNRGSQAATIDAAECCELYPSKSYESRTGPRMVYSNYLLREVINLSDLKALGLDRCADTEMMRTPLLRLKKGQSASSAVEIGEMLNRTSKTDTTTDMREFEKVRRVGSRTNLAIQFGVEVAESSKIPELFLTAMDSIATKGLGREKSVEFGRFVESIADGDENIGSDLFMVPDTVYPAWEAGVPADIVREGLKQNLTMNQIIAIKEHGIAPSVSGGWL